MSSLTKSAPARSKSKASPSADPDAIDGLGQVFQSLRDTRFSFAQIHALTILSNRHHSPLTLSGLAKELGVSTGAVTSIIDKMESLGLAKRVFDTGDRRKIHVAISDKGSHFLSQLAHCFGSASLIKP
jgi:DNA-binding MarR family transcriptional regulator